MVSLTATASLLLLISVLVNPLTLSLVAYAVLNDKVSDQLESGLLLSGTVEFLVVSSDLSRLYEILGNNGIVRVFKEFNTVLAWGDLGLVSRLVREPSVIKVLPNFIVRIQTAGEIRVLNFNSSPIPTIFSWGKSRVGGGVVNKLYNLTGLNVVVAVLDTGVSLSHSELRGKLLTVDPLDERYPGGWIEFDRRGRPICSTPRDTHFHGTWVSSILAGNTLGIAPRARLMHALVLHGGEGTAAQVLAGLEWVLNPYTCTGVSTNVRPDIVSLSIGSSGNYSDIFLTPISKLIERGIVVVGAIGNDGPGTSANPGNIWGVIGVGAINRDDSVADFSSSEYVEWPSQPGSWPFTGTYPRNYVKPDFTAPGVLIPGAYVVDGYYVIASGTSASTPIVSGIVALLKDAWKRLGIEVTVHEVYEVLNRTADRICDISRCGWGVVNVIKAVSYVYGKALNETAIGINASDVMPLDTIELTSANPLTYFIDGDEIGKGTSVIVKLPLLDMGYHFIHAIGDGLYGYLKVYVSSRVLPVNKSVVAGGKLMLLISGFPGFSEILVYLEDNLLTYRPPNTWGSYVLNLVIPYVNPGTYKLMVVDALGLATHVVELSVIGPAIPGPPRELRIYVLGPQVAYVGIRTAVYVVSVIDGRLADLNMLNYRFIEKAPTYIEGPTRLERGVYLIGFIPQEPGIYTVVVEGSSEVDRTVLMDVTALSISVVSEGSDVERRLYLEVSRLCEGVKEVLNDTVSRALSVSEQLSSLSYRVAELYQGLQQLKDSVSALAVTVYVSTFLVIALLAVVIVRRATGRW